jgi:serine/threonine-protein kinase
MAPEQFADFRKAKIPADIYSLGKILYEAIVGKLDQKTVPFKSVHLEAPDTDFLKTMNGIIRKATDENQPNRYQTISEMRRALQNALKLLRKEKQQPQQPSATPATIRWLWAGIASVLIAIGAMTIYHLVDSENSETARVETTQILDENMDRAVFDIENLDSSLIAQDGREMKLVKRPNENHVFYADPTLVTFHHYVEFLNEVSESLTVNDGVVKHDEDIWIYLGDSSAQSDQIIFQHSRFHLRQAQWAPKPLTRVTWLGAEAYARHYGKRLPTSDDWQAIRQQLSIVPDFKTEPPKDTMHSHMQGVSLSTNSRSSQNEKKVVKEWISIKKPNSTSESRVVEWMGADTDQNTTKRYPWEGFEDVGFRTVLDTGADHSLQ